MWWDYSRIKIHYSYSKTYWFWLIIKLCKSLECLLEFLQFQHMIFVCVFIPYSWNKKWVLELPCKGKQEALNVIFNFVMWMRECWTKLWFCCDFFIGRVITSRTWISEWWRFSRGAMETCKALLGVPKKGHRR